jgi:diacylglycerol kinase family enzyme
VKLVLLVNSAASSVTTRTRVVIGKALAADHDVTVVETSRQGHATRLTQNAAATADVVVVLGGDGTLNEAANGLAGTDCALAPLPGGSTNVFARTIGLPNDPVEATGVLLDALAQGSIRRVGLGKIGERYFLFHAGIGFDAAVVDQVERRSSLKRYAGHPLFVLSAVDTWLRHYDRRHPTMAVHVPAAPEADDDAFLTIVLNTNPYTYLGNWPLNLAPAATLDNGLAAVSLRSLRLDRAGPIIASALTGGRRLRSSRWVGHRTDVAEVTVTPYRDLRYQVDGEPIGEARPGEALELRHAPDALNLVYPALPGGGS